MDRGYNDYKTLLSMDGAGDIFRHQAQGQCRLLRGGRNEIPQRDIISDQLIVLADYDKCPHVLRRVVVWDTMHQREIVLLTNHLTFGATTIASIYKDRWQIEIFFKALKQNLKVKTFVGTIRERPLYPDLDSTHCHASDKVSAIHVQDRLVAFQSRGVPALESLYLSRFAGLDQRSVRYTALEPAPIQQIIFA